MDYKLLADNVLLKLLKISDELAYKELYLRYWRKLYHSAVSKTNSKEVAEDIVQSVFTDLWDRREIHQINCIAAYLETAVKYQIINYIKSAISKRTQYAGFGELQKSEDESADLPLLMQELNMAIDKAISQLPQKTQTIFRLSRFEKQSNKEISRIMDLSEKAVEYHITQSLKSLRFFLRDFILVDFILLLFENIIN
ncbi:RNA polymerase sigma-70 factor [Niastella sp. OAS944]|uniref:RNA polymerase sigma-70 factor n=1 Tax=Niastella sp. OAS944 TaxID=2664089 RepID=UPI0034856E24|nr:RNA polymerase sigma-70 factor (ECF subfamily) [Chitinophagaceae bacterium OAS944]